MADIRIGFNPRPAQQLILQRLNFYRFVVAVCHRRLGKTILGVNWLIREGLEKSIDSYRGFYFAPTQKQAKMVSWQYFKNFLGPLTQKGLVHFNETELRIDLPNDGKIYLGSGESIENYRGIYIDRIVLDEIASWQNAEYAYSEVLSPAMADRIAHALIIGTVKGLDKFYDFFQYGLSDLPALADWASIDLKSSLTKILPDSELARLRATMSTDAYEREMENNFFAEMPDVLISPPELIAARDREPDEGLINMSDSVLGIDIGLTGDPSVIAHRRGNFIYPLHVIPSEDPMLTASKISRYIKAMSDPPVTVFVDAGQGLAVISRLRQLGHENIVEVFFNGKAQEINCFNLRATMAYRFKTFLRTGIIPRDDKLLQEAANLHLDDDADNKIRLIKKSKIKAIIGRSPDRCDACMLTFAEPEVEMDDIHALAKKAGIGKNDMAIMRRLQEMQGNNDRVYDVLNFFNNDMNGAYADGYDPMSAIM